MKVLRVFRFPAYWSFIMVLHFHAGVNALFCFRCISLDCRSGVECQNIEKFLKSELETYYHPEDDLYRCPGMDKNITWRVLESDTDPCPEEGQNEGTCTMGRMRIKTGTTVNYGTILGCAKSHLLKRIKTAHESTGKCDYVVHGSTENGGIQMELEHCREISANCHHEDFCVGWTQSKVKQWRKEKNVQSAVNFLEDQPDDTKFWAVVIFGSIGAFLVMMGLRVVWDLCRNRLNEKRDCEKVKDTENQGNSEAPLSNDIEMAAIKPAVSQNTPPPLSTEAENAVSS